MLSNEFTFLRADSCIFYNRAYCSGLAPDSSLRKNDVFLSLQFFFLYYVRTINSICLSFCYPLDSKKKT